LKTGIKMEIIGWLLGIKNSSIFGFTHFFLCLFGHPTHSG
jgi:hypothetical protein